MSSTRIGLDISTSSVRAVQLSVKDNAYRLDRFGQMPLPLGAVQEGEVMDPQAVGTAIRHLWKQSKFRSKKVSIGIASQRVVVRLIEIPYVEPDERRKSLPLMVGDQIPMDLSETVLDFVPLEQGINAEGNATTKGLLVGAAEGVVMKSIEAAEAGGLTVTDVDLTPFALVRALVRADHLGMRQEAEAVVDIGAATTSMVIHVNGVPQFVRILMMGGQDVTERLITDLGVNLPTAESIKRETVLDGGDTMVATIDSPVMIISDVVQQLVDEIRGSLDYYLATGPIDHIDSIVLTGGGSLVPGLQERLEIATGLPVRRGTPLSALGPGDSGLTPDHLSFADPLASAAVGLAIWDDQ